MLQTAMKQILYEDTRQVLGKHDRKNDWWRSHGVEVVRKKLDFGDYVTDESNVSVDTKRNISEVAMDCGRDHDRFAREMERAREAGYRLVILIETTGNFPTVESLAGWMNTSCERCQHFRARTCNPLAKRGGCIKFKRPPMRGETLAKIMATMASDHGCVFELAHPMVAAKRVCDLLGVRYDLHGRT